jgi:hypothetical protein
MEIGRLERSGPVITGTLALRPAAAVTVEGDVMPGANDQTNGIVVVRGWAADPAGKTLPGSIVEPLPTGWRGGQQTLASAEVAEKGKPVGKAGRSRSASQVQVAIPMGDQFKYRIQEAARRLGCCERTVHNLCAEGKLHKRYENRKPYILHSDIMAYLRTLPRIPTPSARVSKRTQPISTVDRT